MNKNFVYIADSDIHGRGLFTNTQIDNDTKIIEVADLKRYNEKKYWISKFGRLVNHKKEGNCVLKKEAGKFYLYSNRVILQHEELTSDYSVLPFPFKSDVSEYNN